MDELDRLAGGWRADADRFRRDVSGLRQDMERELGDGAERAARKLGGALTGAIRKGSLGFEDLRKLALSVLGDIAAAAVKTGLDAILHPGGRGGGLPALAASLLGGGQPGRATGGPVSPGRPYLVGERGPELFVPTAAGRVEAAAPAAARDVRVAIQLATPAGETAPVALRRSSRQLASALRRALADG